MSSKLAAIQVTVDSKVFRSVSNIVSDAQAALEAIYPHIVDDAGIAAYKKAVEELERRTREHIAALFDEATGGKREVVEFPYTEHTEFRAFVVRRQTFAPPSPSSMAPTPPKCSPSWTGPTAAPATPGSMTRDTVRSITA